LTAPGSAGEHDGLDSCCAALVEKAASHSVELCACGADVICEKDSFNVANWPTGSPPLAAANVHDRLVGQVQPVRDNGRMTQVDDRRIDFSLRGISGHIDVSISPNTDPIALGYSLLSYGLPVDFARGFPVCRATVTYPADGYAAIFGWTQMVRSTDAATSDFEMDPIAIYNEVDTPFAWYGTRPELFDAPCRDSRADMIWECHSYLCISPDAVLSRRVQAVAGFSWGFTIAGGEIAFTRTVPLAPTAWDGHLGLLRASHPSWTFEGGYACS
jgi:hypothetical protein